MRRILILLVVSAGLAACKPVEVTLSVEPGFYPSAVAHDPVHDRLFVGSYATGEVAIMRRDGSRLASVRPRGASAPVLQLAYERKPRRLWVLTPDAIEVLDVNALPVRRTVVAYATRSGGFVDLVADGAGRAYTLDALTGDVLEVDAARTGMRIVTRLPVPEGTLQVRAASQCAAQGGAALALLPDRSALIVAMNADWWHVDLRTRAVAPIQHSAPLPYVSQLVVLDQQSGAYRIAALRGQLNDVLTVRLSDGGRVADIEVGSRARFDTPLHGAFDGHQLIVLLGRLRHHPSFCGDGRPNVPARLATYPAGAVEALALARARRD